MAVISANYSLIRYVSPIELTEKESLEDTKALILGWGAEEDNGLSVDRLRGAEIDVFSDPGEALEYKTRSIESRKKQFIKFIIILQFIFDDHVVAMTLLEVNYQLFLAWEALET